MIVIVDYGMGNLGSILNMLRRVGAEAMVSSRVADIESAAKLVLPGVGSFDAGMRRLRELGLVDVLSEKVLRLKTPTLGVCLGMQLLTTSSEEGTEPGLGWIEARTVRFRFEGEQSRLKIPHMGWNTVTIRKKANLFAGMDDQSRFYFVHSYHVVCDDPEDVAATTEYGYEFVSAVERGNITGAQFHPEKSHRFGMKVYTNFVSAC